MFRGRGRRWSAGGGTAVLTVAPSRQTTPPRTASDTGPVAERDNGSIVPEPPPERNLAGRRATTPKFRNYLCFEQRTGRNIPPDPGFRNLGSSRNGEFTNL